MKKLSLVAVCAILVLTSLVFVGCGKNGDGFTQVQSVTINGQQTYDSYFSVTLGELVTSSQDEYDTAAVQLKFDSYSLYSTYFSRLEHQNISTGKENLPKFKNGDTLYFRDDWQNPQTFEWEYIYKKANVTALKINYVSIKIETNKITVKVDGSTTEVKSVDGKVIKSYNSANKLQSITTDFYTIRYFD